MVSRVLSLAAAAAEAAAAIASLRDAGAGNAAINKLCNTLTKRVATEVTRSMRRRRQPRNQSGTFR